MKVKLNDVRIAFPKLFKPERVGDDGELQYSASFIIPKNHPAVKDIETAIKDVAKDKWSDKADIMMKKITAENKLCLKDGDLKAEYDGYAGNLFISANNKNRPFVINRDKTQLNPDDGVIYAGCYVNVVLDIWAMDNKFGKRINATLSGVQFLRDGDAFAGAPRATEDDFDDLSLENQVSEYVSQAQPGEFSIA